MLTILLLIILTIIVFLLLALGVGAWMICETNRMINEHDYSDKQ